MRLSQILEGALDRQYRSMYQALPITDDREIVAFISEISQVLKRQDRIQWMIRWHRCWYAQQLIAKSDNDDLIPEKTLNKFGQAVGMSFERAASEGEDAVEMMDNFKHFLGLPIKAIQDIVWDKQRPAELLGHIQIVENDWIDNISDKTVLQKSSDTEVIKFPDGYVWFNLNRGECSLEASAMGHCGNDGNGYNNTILSLRKPIYDDRWEPALTFILDDDGFLGEMKGRGNEKPADHYHPYIVALLKNPIVQGIKGGGYLPENNFSMDDLDNAIRETLYKMKPSLKPVWEQYKPWHEAKQNKTLTPEMDDGFRVTLEKYVSSRGGFRDIDYDREEIVFNKQSLRNATYNGNLLGEIENVLDEDFLANAFINAGLDDSKAENMAKAANQKYLDQAMAVAVPYNFTFKVSCVYAELRGNVILTMASIRGVVYEEDDSIENSIRDFSEEDEYFYYDEYSESPQDEDPVIDALLSYGVKKCSNKSADIELRDVINELLEALDDGGEDQQYGTRTTRDPRQMSFNFNPQR